jgi:hypothetical protein
VTFAIGITGFWAYGVYKEIVSSMNNTVAIKNPDSGKPKTFVLPVYLSDGELMKVDVKENERFTLLGHACGNGYVQGYITNEGERLSTGLDIIKPKDFQKEVVEAEILSKIENYENTDGKKGTRFILKGRNNKTGKEFYELIWYDQKRNKYYITAPSLDLALEFEQWQKSQK